jgi:hypothetical protein
MPVLSARITARCCLNFSISSAYVIFFPFVFLDSCNREYSLFAGNASLFAFNNQIDYDAVKCNHMYRRLSEFTAAKIFAFNGENGDICRARNRFVETAVGMDAED